MEERKTSLTVKKYRNKMFELVLGSKFELNLGSISPPCYYKQHYNMNAEHNEFELRHNQNLPHTSPLKLLFTAPHIMEYNVLYFNRSALYSSQTDPTGRGMKVCQ